MFISFLLRRSRRALAFFFPEPAICIILWLSSMVPCLHVFPLFLEQSARTRAVTGISGNHSLATQEWILRGRIPYKPAMMTSYFQRITTFSPYYIGELSTSRFRLPDKIANLLPATFHMRFLPCLQPPHRALSSQMQNTDYYPLNLSRKLRFISFLVCPLSPSIFFK